MGPIEAFTKFFNRTSAADLARAVYGEDADEEYVGEKAHAILRNPIVWMSSLDSVNMGRLEALVENYRVTARK